ncbi:MAG: hypothetical protein Q8R33_17160 [Burkholderiales bacterium]|nr:hypothetical protein [Burkholderiales bacterium]
MRHPIHLALITAGALGALLLGSCATPFEPDRTARAPALDGFGTLPMKITTRVPAAQHWFTQGMLQTYAFNDQEAARAFKAALAQDPACAMCAWGVAHALGPNINAVDRGDLSEARRYTALAQRHLSGVTPGERALIEAMAARYADPDTKPAVQDVPALASVCGGGSAKKADPLDIVYVARMRALVEAHPDDPDLTTLYAEAVMIATRGDWWNRQTGAPAPEIDTMTLRLEQALAKALNHTGLNHYLIHAVDMSPAPQRASAAADRLGMLAPEAPHLVHMPAHIYVRTARFADAAAVNQSALAAQQRQNEKQKAQGFATSDNWDFHNLHFLWYAALMQGRGGVAMAQAQQLAERAAKGKSATAEFLRSLPLLTLVRLERWDEVLRQPAVAGEAGVATPIGHYARGVALARTGQLPAAREAAVALQTALALPALASKTVMGDDPASTVLEVLGARLQAEVAAASGDAPGAQATLQAAVTREAALEAVEPPLLGAGSRLAQGSLMLRSRRWADAEAAYRSDLADQPGSGWALRGLQQALARQGKTEEAGRVQRELNQAWSSADAALRTATDL